MERRLASMGQGGSPVTLTLMLKNTRLRCHTSVKYKAKRLPGAINLQTKKVTDNLWKNTTTNVMVHTALGCTPHNQAQWTLYQQMHRQGKHQSGCGGNGKRKQSHRPCSIQRGHANLRPGRQQRLRYTLQ